MNWTDFILAFISLVTVGVIAGWVMASILDAIIGDRLGRR